jgi:hypothetical protein
MSERIDTDARSGRAAESFYARVFSEADRVALREARAIGGIDEEVAVLRMLLRRTLATQPDDLKAIEGAMRLVVQALVAQRKLTPADDEALTVSLTRVLERVDLQAADVD